MQWGWWTGSGVKSHRGAREMARDLPLNSLAVVVQSEANQHQDAAVGLVAWQVWVWEQQSAVTESGRGQRHKLAPNCPWWQPGGGAWMTCMTSPLWLSRHLRLDDCDLMLLEDWRLLCSELAMLNETRLHLRVEDEGGRVFWKATDEILRPTLICP